MKLYLILALFTVLVGSGQETNGITTKVLERDRDKDGKIDQRIETVSRNKTVILRIHTTILAGVTNIARSYFAGGELAMMEIDENGDGFFEKVFVYNPAGENEIEVFDRRVDGGAQPVSAEVLARFKRQHGAISKFFEVGFEEDLDKTMARLRALQKEISGADKKESGKK